MSGRCSPLPKSVDNDLSRKQSRHFSECASPFSPKRRLMFVDSVFKGETYYLDPKAFNTSAAVADIERNIQLLGGKVERFMCKDVTCVVSDRKESSRTAPGKDGFSPQCSASPMSRGQALLLKAQNNSNKNCTDVITTAKQLGIKVLDAKKLTTKIQEQLARCDPNGRWDHVKQSKRKGQCTKKTRAISGNYIKFEHESVSFRPVYGRFNNFPVLYFHDESDGSPFDLEPKKQVLPKKVTPPVKREAKLNSKFSNTPKLPTSKQKARQHALKPKSGYCESCELHFNDLNKHVISKTHLNFIANKENFASLDKYLNNLPAISDLIGDVSSGNISGTALQVSAGDESKKTVFAVGGKKHHSGNCATSQQKTNLPNAGLTETSPWYNNKYVFGEAFNNKTPSFSASSFTVNEDSVQNSKSKPCLSHESKPSGTAENLAPDQNTNKLYRRLFDGGEEEPVKEVVSPAKRQDKDPVFLELPVNKKAETLVDLSIEVVETSQNATEVISGGCQPGVHDLHSVLSLHDSASIFKQTISEHFSVDIFKDVPFNQAQEASPYTSTVVNSSVPVDLVREVPFNPTQEASRYTSTVVNSSVPVDLVKEVPFHPTQEASPYTSTVASSGVAVDLLKEVPFHPTQEASPYPSTVVNSSVPVDLVKEVPFHPTQETSPYTSTVVSSGVAVDLVKETPFNQGREASPYTSAVVTSGVPVDLVKDVSFNQGREASPYTSTVVSNGVQQITSYVHSTLDVQHDSADTIHSMPNIQHDNVDTVHRTLNIQHGNVDTVHSSLDVLQNSVQTSCGMSYIQCDSVDSLKQTKSDINFNSLNDVDPATSVINNECTNNVTDEGQFKIDCGTGNGNSGQSSEGGLSQKGINGYNISYSDISHPDIYQQGNVSHYNISSFLDNWQPLSSKLDTIIESVISGGHTKTIIPDKAEENSEVAFSVEDEVVQVQNNAMDLNTCILQSDLTQQSLPPELSGVSTDRMFSDISDCNTSQGNETIAYSNSDAMAIVNVNNLKHSTSLTENYKKSSAFTSTNFESSQTVSSKSCSISLGPPELSIFETEPNDVVEYSDPPQLSVCVPVLSEQSLLGSTHLYEEEPESIPEMPVLDAAVTCGGCSSSDSSSTLCSLTTSSSSSSETSSTESSSSCLHSGNLFGQQKKVSFTKCDGGVKSVFLDVCAKSFRRILTPKRRRNVSSMLGTSDAGVTRSEEQHNDLCEKLKDCSLTRETDTALDILKQLCDNFILPESETSNPKDEVVNCEANSQLQETSCEVSKINDEVNAKCGVSEMNNGVTETCEPDALNGKFYEGMEMKENNIGGTTIENNTTVPFEEVDPQTKVEFVDLPVSDREFVTDKKEIAVSHVVMDIENIICEVQSSEKVAIECCGESQQPVRAQIQTGENEQSVEDSECKNGYSFISESDSDSKWNTSLKLTCDNILNKLDTDMKDTNIDNKCTSDGSCDVISRENYEDTSGSLLTQDICRQSMTDQTLKTCETPLGNNSFTFHSLNTGCPSSTNHELFSFNGHFDPGTQSCKSNLNTTVMDNVNNNNFSDLCSLPSSIATVLKESMYLVDGVGPNSEDYCEMPSPREAYSSEFSHTILEENVYMSDMYTSPHVALQSFDPVQETESGNKSLPFKKRHLILDLQHQVTTGPPTLQTDQSGSKPKKRARKRVVKPKPKTKIFSSKTPFSMKKASTECDSVHSTGVLPIIDESSCDSAIIDVCGISDNEDSTLDKTLVASTTDAQMCDDGFGKRHFPVSDITNKTKNGQVFPRLDSFESSCSLKSTSSGYVSELHSSNEVKPKVTKKRGRPKKGNNKENQPDIDVIKPSKKRTKSDLSDGIDIDGGLAKKWKASADVVQSDCCLDNASSKESCDLEWKIKPLGGLKLKLSRMSSYEASSEQTDLEEQADEAVYCKSFEPLKKLKLCFRKTQNEGYETETSVKSNNSHKTLTKVKKRKSVV